MFTDNPFGEMDSPSAWATTTLRVEEKPRTKTFAECDHGPFGDCDCGAVQPESEPVEMEDLPSFEATAASLPRRSDGVILFRTDLKYLVIVGKRTLKAAQAAFKGFGNVEVLPTHPRLPRPEYEAKTAGMDVVFYIKKPHGGAEYGTNKHALVVHDTGHGIADLKGFFGSIAADVDITADGQLVFSEPSAWDMLPTDYLVVYDAVEGIVEETGKPAGVGQVSKEVEITRQTATKRCSMLVGKGYLTRVGVKYRPAE